jgi:formate-dependent nitrite reductase cytochrome c552 subunit
VSPRKSQRATNVAYYWRNREFEIERVRVRQNGAVEMLRELREVPCVDCGGRFEPYQMDFDHRDPSTKDFNVMTGRAMLMSTARLMAEVAKCDIVCANCHRVRTKHRSTNRPRTGRYTAPSQARRMRLWKQRAALLDELRAFPCSDCGLRYPTAAMDFDHRQPDAKRSTLSRMVVSSTLEEIRAEASKSDVVCANCHRMRTYRRRQAA